MADEVIPPAPPPPPPHTNTVQVNIVKTMSAPPSYVDYAMSVIIGRASCPMCATA